MSLDVLVIAAHPDDAEISVGGTIAKLVAAGRRVGVIDLTRGEMGTRGSEADRSAEAKAATRVLGLSTRENLGLPDGRIEVTPASREALAKKIRALRPDIVLAHHTEDLHPDHEAAGRLAREAWYLSGLKRLAMPPHDEANAPEARRPGRIFHFQGHVPFDPTFVVDVTEVWETKREAILAYATQFEPAGEDDKGEHFLFGADILQRAETKARFFGELIGTKFGEPLLHRGPLSSDDWTLFTGR